MELKAFIRELVIFSLFVAFILIIVQQIPRWDGFYPFSWICWFFFLCISGFTTLVGYRSAGSSNNTALTNISMGFILGKMILAIILVFGYAQIMQPVDRTFLIPFFFIYFSFTIFEIHQIVNLGKLKSNDNHK